MCNMKIARLRALLTTTIILAILTTSYFVIHPIYAESNLKDITTTVTAMPVS